MGAMTIFDRTEAERMIAEADQSGFGFPMADQLSAALLELDRLRSVVTAACAFREALCDENADCPAELNALMEAVDRYREPTP